MSGESGGAPPREDDWRLRAYRPGDERGIEEGFERVFGSGRAISEATWLWKHQTRPSSVDTVWIAVDRDERPVFHYAGMPRRLRLPGGTFDAMVAVDAWTLPEFRRRGLFTRCAGWVHETWHRAGVVGLLGAPNDQWGTRDHHLGWRHLFPLRWLIRPLRPEALAARRLRLPALGRFRGIGKVWNRSWDLGRRGLPGIRVREVDAEGLEAVDGSPSERWGFERGEEWARWRYGACPRHHYRLLSAERADRSVGYLAYRIEDSGDRTFAYIAELTVEEDDPDVEQALISTAIERVAKTGAVAVATLAVPGTDRYRIWRRRGFLFSWGSFGIQCLPFGAEMSPEVLREPRHWDLAGGDLDVI